MSISQLLLGPYAPNILEAPKTHRNICRLLGRCWHTCRLSTSNKNQSQVEQRHGRVGRSVFQLLLGPHAPNVLWRFLRHIGRFLDHLGDVDTPIGRALAPKLQAKLNKYMESGEINISASIRASHIKFGLEVSETHKNISRPLWDIKTPAGRMSVPKAEPSWANTFGVRSSISQLLLGPHAPNFWEVPETHRNIPRLPGRFWHTCRQSTSAQKMNHRQQIHGEWGAQYLGFH